MTLNLIYLLILFPRNLLNLKCEIVTLQLTQVHEEIIQAKNDRLSKPSRKNRLFLSYTANTYSLA